MTSVAQERGGAPDPGLWEETVRAVLRGFESAFDCETTSREIVKEERQGKPSDDNTVVLDIPSGRRS